MTDYIGVKIALIIDNNLLMIRRDDKPGLRFAGMWDFPGGGREGDESPEQCAIREVREELGIVIRRDQIAYKKMHQAMHDPNVDAYFLVAKVTANDIHKIVFGDEGQGWRLFDIKEFFESDVVVEPLKGRLTLFLKSERIIS